VRAGHTITTHVDVSEKDDRSKPNSILAFRDTATNRYGTPVYAVEKIVLILKQRPICA